MMSHASRLRLVALLKHIKKEYKYVSIYPLMNALYNWNIYNKNGYLYCEGEWYSGKGWITSSIQAMTTGPGYYIIYTENSIYYLYW